MTLRFVVVGACLAIMALETMAIASAKDMSTCETLSGSFSGPEKTTSLRNARKHLRADMSAWRSIIVAKKARGTAVTQPASSTVTLKNTGLANLRKYRHPRK